MPPKEDLPDDPFENLFTRLDAQLKNNQSKKALKTVDEILKLDGANADALKCKAVLLIEASRFEEALDLLEAKQLSASLAFEKAYALYRLGRFTEALKAVAAVADDRVEQRLHLQAQLHYRLGQAGDAISCYSTLSQRHKVTSLELQTNIVAAYVAGGRAAEAPALMEALRATAGESFEYAFNRACALLDNGDLEAAEKQLQLAERLGRETLVDEEFTNEQIEAELAPLTAQLAYLASRLGRAEDAVASYTELLTRGQGDEATNAVLQNNLAAERLAATSGAQQKKLLGELLKKFEALLDKEDPGRLRPSLQARLSTAQRRALLLNNALLLLLSGQSEAAAAAVVAVQREDPDSEAATLVQAAIHARGGKPTEAAKLVSEAARRNKSLPLSLAAAQLAIAEHDTQQALGVLASIEEVALRDAPAVVATRLALLEADGDVASALAQARAALDKASRDRSAGKSERAAAIAFLQSRIAQLQLAAGDVDGAVESYKALKAADAAAGSTAVLAQIIQVAARRDPAAALSLEAELPALDPLDPSAVDALESRGRRRQGGRHAAGGEDAAAPQRKKKKRKIIWPKGVDPESPGPPPDPERWLPKAQRSDFRRKKGRSRNKAKDQLKGSQGAGVVDESLDRSNAVAEEEGPFRPPPRQQNAGKGKKKGRR